jgi:hypothetical protein
MASNVPVQKKEKNIELNLHIFWFKEGHASQLWEFFILKKHTMPSPAPI